MLALVIVAGGLMTSPSTAPPAAAATFSASMESSPAADPARHGIPPVPPLAAEGPPLAPLRIAAPARPAPLVPLYLAFVALQVADVASTRRALEAGGREANPIVRGLANNSAAMLAVKAGATAGTIYLVERLWKKNRTAAVILMTALNGAYAAIVAYNYRGHRQR